MPDLSPNESGHLVYRYSTEEFQEILDKHGARSLADLRWVEQPLCPPCAGCKMWLVTAQYFRIDSLSVGGPSSLSQNRRARCNCGFDWSIVRTNAYPTKTATVKVLVDNVECYRGQYVRLCSLTELTELRGQFLRKQESEGRTDMLLHRPSGPRQRESESVDDWPNFFGVDRHPSSAPRLSGYRLDSSAWSESRFLSYGSLSDSTTENTRTPPVAQTLEDRMSSAMSYWRHLEQALREPEGD